jgi:hypothetical protein
MALKANIVIDQGTTFASDISILDQNEEAVDLTNYVARGQIRKTYTSTTAVDFTTALANGVLVLSLTANQTANIVSGRYVYDVELVDNANNVVRILEGIVTITPEVTRT